MTSTLLKNKISTTWAKWCQYLILASYEKKTYIFYYNISEQVSGKIIKLVSAQKKVALEAMSIWLSSGLHWTLKPRQGENLLVNYQSLPQHYTLINGQTLHTAVLWGFTATEIIKWALFYLSLYFEKKCAPLEIFVSNIVGNIFFSSSISYRFRGTGVQKVFLFHLKSVFRIFKFLPWLFSHLEKRLD